MRHLIILAVSALLLGGCTRKVYLPVENLSHRTDTLLTLRERVDTLLQRDSIFVAQRGDTIVREAWHTTTKIRVKTDTIVRNHTDTIVRQVIVTQPTKPTFKERVGSTALTAAALLIIAALALLTIKKLTRK